MRSYLPSFAMRQARTLDEALALMAQPPGAWRPFAGGTDLMVLLAAGALRHQHFVSIWGIAELRRITVTDDSVYVGALTTFTDVQRHDTLRAEFPLLCRAAADIAGSGHASRAPGLRRGAGHRVGSRPPPGAVQPVSYRL
jgi:CO/xanthine dehydrogenase FAD-binding subunit